MSWPGIKCGKNYKWTDEEKALLEKAFVQGGSTAAMEVLPGRTAKAIRRMAVELDLRVDPDVKSRNASERNKRIAESAAERNKATLGDVLTLRRRGLSVAEICDECGISETTVHQMLEGQPRRIRLRGEGIGEVAA